MRALIVVRLSRLTDASTSPERQLEKCRELCEQRGYEVVGIAEDLDVSASATTPFDRPQLGDRLANRFNEFDVLVFFRADRIVRRLFDLSDLIRWSREHSVTLVSATESYFDLSSEFGDIIALLVAKVPPPTKRWPVERTTPPPVATPGLGTADVRQFIDSTDIIMIMGNDPAEWGYAGVPAELRVKVALKACELLDGGAHMGGASTYIVTALDDRRENAGYLAAWFAQDAVMTFCPDTRPQWRSHAVSTFDEQN